VLFTLILILPSSGGLVLVNHVLPSQWPLQFGPENQYTEGANLLQMSW
jgi:hypothetical protein